MPAARSVTQADDLRQRVLEHVVRYRLATPGVLAELSDLRGLGRQRRRAFLHELCCQQLLGRASLFGNRWYFHLHAQLRSLPGVIPTDLLPVGPLSERAKLRCFAMEQFCCCSTGRRTCKRLTHSELERHFAGHVQAGQPVNYYLDRSDPVPRMGVIRIDAGGRGRWDRVLAKCRQALDAHAMHPGFRELLQAGQFELTLITALPHKALRLQESVAQWNDWYGQRLRIVAVPDLVQLIAPVATAERD